MKNKNLLNHLCKRMWTRKIVMTDWSLGLVMLVAAAAGATATVLAQPTIKRIIMKISTPKSSQGSSGSPPEFHDTAYSAEFSESWKDS